MDVSNLLICRGYNPVTKYHGHRSSNRKNDEFSVGFFLSRTLFRLFFVKENRENNMERYVDVQVEAVWCCFRFVKAFGVCLKRINK